MEFFFIFLCFCHVESVGPEDICCASVLSKSALVLGYISVELGVDPVQKYVGQYFSYAVEQSDGSGI